MYITLGTLLRRPERQNLIEGMTESDMEFVDYFSAYIPIDIKHQTPQELDS
jgi:hypothetical protein